MLNIFYNFLHNSFDYNLLKKFRKERKLSLAKVAAKTGIPSTTLQRYEDGETKKLPIESLKILTKLYGKNIDELLMLNRIPLINTLEGQFLFELYGVKISERNFLEEKKIFQDEEYIKFKEIAERLLEIHKLVYHKREKIERFLLIAYLLSKQEK